MKYSTGMYNMYGYDKWLKHLDSNEPRKNMLLVYKVHYCIKDDEVNIEKIIMLYKKLCLFIVYGIHKYTYSF